MAFACLNIKNLEVFMDNILKSIVVAGVVNLLTHSLILALSLAWMYYYYHEAI